MFASGVPTAEKPQAKKYYLMAYGANAEEEEGNSWRNYKGYKDQTSILVPLPPAIYKPLPHWIKTWILMDFPMYRFDEQKDGSAALEEERKAGGNAA